MYRSMENYKRPFIQSPIFVFYMVSEPITQIEFFRPFSEYIVRVIKVVRVGF